MLLKLPKELVFKYTVKDDRYDDTWKFTNIRNLAKDKQAKEWDPAAQEVLLLYVLYWKCQTASEKVPYFNRGGKQGGSMNYDRMCVCWDPLAPAGMNLVTLLVGRGHNPNLFNKYLNERDTGTFSKLIIITYCVLVGTNGTV